MDFGHKKDVPSYHIKAGCRDYSRMMGHAVVGSSTIAVRALAGVGVCFLFAGGEGKGRKEGRKQLIIRK